MHTLSASTSVLVEVAQRQFTLPLFLFLFTSGRQCCGLQFACFPLPSRVFAHSAAVPLGHYGWPDDTGHSGLVVVLLIVCTARPAQRSLNCCRKAREQTREK